MARVPPAASRPYCPPLTPSCLTAGQPEPLRHPVKSLPVLQRAPFLLANHRLRSKALAGAHRSNVRGRHRQGAGSCEAGVGPNVAALPRSVARARPDFPGVAAAAERLEEAAGWRSCC